MGSAKASVAAITMLAGADGFLPRWLAHYRGSLPENHIYVLNFGADAEVARMVAEAGAGINLVNLPLALDAPEAVATRWKILSQFASGLTQFYNWVIIGETDELIAPDPESGVDLVTCLMARAAGDTAPPAVLVPFPIELVRAAPGLGEGPHYRLNAARARPSIASQGLEYSPDGRASKHQDLALDPQLCAFYLRLAETEVEGPVMVSDWPHAAFRRTLLEEAYREDRFLRLGGGTRSELYRLPDRFAGLI